VTSTVVGRFPEVEAIEQQQSTLLDLFLCSLCVIRRVDEKQYVIE
jgi:hypothetical protein